MARAYLRQRRARRAVQPQGIGREVRNLLKGKASPEASFSRIQLDWSELVGPSIAAISRPVKLSGTKAGRTLTIRVLPAAAALIQHQEEMLRQRLSVAAGGNITKLRIEQGPLPGAPARREPPGRDLSPEELAGLEAATAGIGNARLRAAIVALGRAVLADGDRTS